MIRETLEEFRIMLYLIGYGIFCISTYDTILFFIENMKKAVRLSILIIYSVLIIFFTYEFSYKLAYGYIPIHFIIFLIMGFLIYFLIRRVYQEGLEHIRIIYFNIKKPLIKTIFFSVYPKEIITIIKVMIRTVKNTIIKSLKEVKRKNKKRNNKLSK